MASRFDYVKYDDMAQIDQVNFKQRFEELERKLIGTLRSGRALSLALTSLEETYMWVGKAIRDDQIARNGTAPLQEERVTS